MATLVKNLVSIFALSFLFFTMLPTGASFSFEIFADPGDACNVASSDNDCDKNSTFLYCLDMGTGVGECQCPTDSQWNYDFSWCVLYPDAPCVIEEQGGGQQQPCQEFSECLASSETGAKCECMAGTTIVENFCKATFGNNCQWMGIGYPDCDSSSFLSCNLADLRCHCMVGHEPQDGDRQLCTAYFNDSCAGTGAECAPSKFLICSSSTPKICECKPGTVFIDNECKAKIDQPCDLNGSTNPICDNSSHLVCTSDICKCNEGTTTDASGVCKATINQPCAYDGFDEPDCYEADFLQCRENVCLCLEGLEETENSKCRVKISGICNSQYLLCDEDSLLQCNTTINTCTCEEGTIENGNGECRVGINQLCDNIFLCDDTSYLECSADGVCTCSAGSQDDDGDGECRMDMGQNCGDAGAPPCDENQFIVCIDNKCQCRPNTIGVGGMCAALIDASCDPQKWTNPLCFEGNHLICNPTSNTCECKNGTTNVGGVCKAAIGEPCDPAGGAGPACDDTKFLDCIENVCQCRSDLHDNGNGECRAGLGSACVAEGGPLCDEFQFLVCNDTSYTCECQTGTTNVGGVCKAAIGEPCDPAGGAGPACDDTKFLDCIENVCQCRSDLHDNGNGECRAGLGSACVAEGGPLCDEFQFLVCNVEQRCICKDGLSNDGGKCVANIGGSCADGELCDPANFLVCDSQASKTCDCRGDLDNLDGICTAGYGDTCALGEPCDTDKHLECLNNDKCDCEPNYVYDGFECRVAGNDQPIITFIDDDPSVYAQISCQGPNLASFILVDCSDKQDCDTTLDCLHDNKYDAATCETTITEAEQNCGVDRDPNCWKLGFQDVSTYLGLLECSIRLDEQNLTTVTDLISPNVAGEPALLSNKNASFWTQLTIMPLWRPNDSFTFFDDENRRLLYDSEPLEISCMVRKMAAIMTDIFLSAEYLGGNNSALEGTVSNFSRLDYTRTHDNFVVSKDLTQFICSSAIDPQFRQSVDVRLGVSEPATFDPENSDSGTITFGFGDDRMELTTSFVGGVPLVTEFLWLQNNQQLDFNPKKGGWQNTVVFDQSRNLIKSTVSRIGDVSEDLGGTYTAIFQHPSGNLRNDINVVIFSTTTDSSTSSSTTEEVTDTTTTEDTGTDTTTTTEINVIGTSTTELTADDQGGGLGLATILGICGGALALVIVLVGGGYVIWRRRSATGGSKNNFGSSNGARRGKKILTDKEVEAFRFGKKPPEPKPPKPPGLQAVIMDKVDKIRDAIKRPPTEDVRRLSESSSSKVDSESIIPQAETSGGGTSHSASIPNPADIAGIGSTSANLATSGQSGGGIVSGGGDDQSMFADSAKSHDDQIYELIIDDSEDIYGSLHPGDVDDGQNDFESTQNNLTTWEKMEEQFQLGAINLAAISQLEFGADGQPNFENQEMDDSVPCYTEQIEKMRKMEKSIARRNRTVAMLTACLGTVLGLCRIPLPGSLLTSSLAFIGIGVGGAIGGIGVGIGASLEAFKEFVQQIPFSSFFEIPTAELTPEKGVSLGEGQSSKVYRGEYQGKKVAIKSSKDDKKKEDKDYFEAMLLEAKIMALVGKHPNIVEFLGACTTEIQQGILYVVMELSPLGDLHSYLQDKQNRFHSAITKLAGPITNVDDITSSHLVNFCLQIASGMRHVCSKKVLHGDLAIRNVLVFHDNVVKITDFGLARILCSEKHVEENLKGSIPWTHAALESLMFRQYSSKSDAWAYGVTMWEIFSLGEMPYSTISANFLSEFCTLLDSGFRLSKPYHASQEIYSIMRKCWLRSPEQRPTFDQLETWVNDICYDYSSGRHRIIYTLPNTQILEPATKLNENLIPNFHQGYASHA